MDIIQFSHSNGFPAETYQSFLKLFEPEYQIQYVNKFGHGDFPIRPGWRALTRELIQAISKQSRPVIGLGHSLGAVLTYKAAIQRPDLFSKIILIEPPIFMGKRARIFYIAQLLGLGERANPLSRRAKNRRNYFSSREEAYGYFKEKFLFKNFDPRALDDYIAYGLKETEEGYALAFEPQLEAKLFGSLPLRHTWKTPVPILFMYAEKGSVLTVETLGQLRIKLPQAQFLGFQGGGHMFPLESQEDCYQFIKSFLDS